jgi:putative phage-type endonuclease
VRLKSYKDYGFFIYHRNPLEAMDRFILHPKVKELFLREQIPQRTPRWYEVRKTLITASEAASALDIKPFASYSGSPRAELLKAKREPVGAGIDNVFTRHGQKYEDEARDLYCAKTGEQAYEFGLIIHTDYPWLGCSVDGITASGKVLEIKCPLSRKIVPGHVPEHYMPQVQICMEVCDLEEAIFIQYKPESITWPNEAEFVVTRVPRDREWFQRVMPALRAFVEEMKRAPPEPPKTIFDLPLPSVAVPPPRPPAPKPPVVCHITEEDAAPSLPSLEWEGDAMEPIAVCLVDTEPVMRRPRGDALRAPHGAAGPRGGSTQPFMTSADGVA